MPNTDAKIQLNFKTPGNTLINLYASNTGELDEELDIVEARIPRIVALEQALGAVGSLPLAAPSQQPATAPAVAAAPPVGGGDSAPTTSAGVRVIPDKWGNTWTYGLPDAPATPDGQRYILKSGKSKAGSAYSGWFDYRYGPEHTGPKPDKSTEFATIWPPR